MPRQKLSSDVLIHEGRKIPKGRSEVKRLTRLIDFTLRAAPSPGPHHQSNSLIWGLGEKLHYRLPAILNPAIQEQLLFPLNADSEPRRLLCKNVSELILRKRGRPRGQESEAWNDQPALTLLRQGASRVSGL